MFLNSLVELESKFSLHSPTHTACKQASKSSAAGSAALMSSHLERSASANVCHNTTS
jgi:hypothetical protein